MIHVGKIKLRDSWQTQLKYNGGKRIKIPSPPTPVKPQTLNVDLDRPCSSFIYLFLQDTYSTDILIGHMLGTHVAWERERKIQTFPEHRSHLWSLWRNRAGDDRSWYPIWMKQLIELEDSNKAHTHQEVDYNVHIVDSLLNATSGFGVC